MTTEIYGELPQGAVFFLVNQEERPRTLLHVLEKTYIPMPVVVDYQDQEIGLTLYRQPSMGIPFGRSYVVDPDGVVTAVLAGYSPGQVMDEIVAAMP